MDYLGADVFRERVETLIHLLSINLFIAIGLKFVLSRSIDINEDLKECL